LQAYYILDELFIGGHLQESSKNEVLRVRLLPRTGCMMGSTGTGRVMDASEGQKMRRACFIVESSSPCLTVIF
jgi:hypothetical protein